MFKSTPRRSVLALTIASLAAAGTMGVTSPVLAQQAEPLEEVLITGSRIRRPGLVSSSPITSVGSLQIEQQQEVTIEKVIRDMPFSIPGDGQNVNNGTAGAATINLRGLGPQRNLVLMNGRRMTPFNYNGQVDVSAIPLALVERIDVITGGASAVYGSDAIAGAMNVVLKNDFEGVDLQVNRSETGDNDGTTDSISLTLGSSLAEGRGNVAFNLSWSERKPVLLGQRFLGTLGIETASGANYAEFLAGQGAAPSAIAGCVGPDAVASGGSTTAIPTRVELSAGGSVGQFLEDRTLYTGDAGTGLGARGGCSVFNFNPYNYYQTPNERYNATLIGNYEFSEKLDVYSQMSFTDATVAQQVAPSGTFGTSFDVPMYNPLWPAAAKAEVLAVANQRLASGVLKPGTNWKDTNANGVVDSADTLRMRLRRRTVELGARSENYDTEQFTFLTGARGELYGDWNYDASFQYGETNRTTVRAGYTNLTNIQNALMTKDGVNCENGDSSCVPIDLFGGFGTITPAMAAYAQAIALQQQKYDQTILNFNVDGPIDAIVMPAAETPLAVSLGYEKRIENGSLEPDECLKLAPASCQGGAGGNLLPISGGFKVDEFYFEANLPLIEGMQFVDSLNLDIGARTSDYDTVGSVETWKAGLNWTVNEQLLVRVMQQDATRAPNIGELFSPVTRGLGNATLDPCSVANTSIDSTLSSLCVSSGMLAAQVGTVQDIIAGQIQTFDGSDPANPPGAEQADTTTVGFVWTPDFDFFDNFVLSVDYYDIKVNDIIGSFSAQEVLDSCYVLGDLASCGKVKRVNGDLLDDTAGIILYTTNLSYAQAEGVEIGFNLSKDLGGNRGSLTFSGNINKYLTQQSLSSPTVPVIDCKGFVGTSCDPISELRWVQNTTWDWNDLSVNLQWRHIGSVDVERPEVAGTFPAFRSIDDYNYWDLFVSYNFWDDRVKLSAGIQNLTDEDPPVLGNELGDTSSNSGNTFPSNYDPLGQVYTVGFRITL
jgi:iron complex outermembrane receptor protein